MLSSRLLPLERAEVCLRMYHNLNNMPKLISKPARLPRFCSCCLYLITPSLTPSCFSRDAKDNLEILMMRWSLSCTDLESDVFYEQRG